MMQAFIAVAALVAGILLGYMIRENSAKSEKALLEKQVSGSTEALAAAQRQSPQAQAFGRTLAPASNPSPPSARRPSSSSPPNAMLARQQVQAGLRYRPRSGRSHQPA